MIKNVIKLSLVAATAVAGISTASSAGKLEDAIKNTDLTGYVRYRYTDGSNDQNTSEGPFSRDPITNAPGAIEQTHQYRTVFDIKSKVNDMVTANLRTDLQGTITDETGDQDPNLLTFTHANFIFNTGFATITAGKQGVPTPFADALEQQGTGVVAVLPAGPVNIAAGWFFNTDVTSGNINADANSTDRPANAAPVGAHNLVALGVMGKASVVDFGVWLAKLSDGGDSNSVTDANSPDSNTSLEGAGATAINLNVGVNIGTLKIEVNHAQVAYDIDESLKTDKTTDDPTNTQTRVMGTIDAGTVQATIGVILTGEDGGDVTFGDTDAKANFDGRDFHASSTRDATIFNFKAAMPLGAVTLWAQHITTDDTDGQSAKDANGKDVETDATETSLGFNYAMTKNFSISGYYAQAEYINEKDSEETEDTYDKQRIEMKYTF